MHDPILLIKNNLNNIIKEFHSEQKKEINIEMLNNDQKNELLLIARKIIEEYIPFEETIDIKHMNCFIETMIDTTFVFRDYKKTNISTDLKKVIRVILFFYQAFYENHFNFIKKKHEESENQLLRSLVVAQENERKKIAIALHDDIVQSLAAILLRIQLIRNMVNDEEGIKQEIIGIEKFLRNIITKCRLVSFDMDSFWLENAGFIPTIQAILRDFENKNDIKVYLEVEDFCNDISRFTLIHLFRVIQEALRNIQKHAGATKIVISLSIIDDNRIILSINDNGRGFNVAEENLRKGNSTSQFGLISIEQRTKLLKGNFIIKTAQGSGTTLIVDVPIERKSFVETSYKRKASPWIRSAL